MVTTGMMKRAEFRKHLRIQQQLKVGTLTLVALLLLAAYPVYLFTTAVAQDPVFTVLDDLEIPAWANYDHTDAASGSRWCIGECRFRTRTWLSERAPDETSPAYGTALTNGGWRTLTDGYCPQLADGVMTCWKKDEYIMEMWVRAPICDVPPPRATIDGASPSAEPTPQAGPTRPACPGALVTMSVYNAIDHKAPTGLSPEKPRSGTPWAQNGEPRAVWCMPSRSR
jgi:integrin beta 3